jgi:dTDP-4-amino-4,6-dideoxygalactose transaminase
MKGKCREQASVGPANRLFTRGGHMTVHQNSGVPFFRPTIADSEIQEVISVLRSGWLTTGPRTAQFEKDFSSLVGARHAVAVNSCTAALHLAVEALGLERGQAVLVPTMTFAATAEVVRYCSALPILVDCDAETLNIDLEDAERKLSSMTERLRYNGDSEARPVGIMPVHVGGFMADIGALRDFATRHSLWIVEDAAHAFPAAWRTDETEAWQRCGEHTADVSCFSFYANKTITTGEGGMAVTDDAELEERIRLMSLHGLSKAAWTRYSTDGSWDYRILAPGYKYNMTDIAAALGIHQAARAEEMRKDRERVAYRYMKAFGSMDEIELPPIDTNRIHSWHLFPIKLRLDSLDIDRDAFIQLLKLRGVGCSVHWRPLHLHPYYQKMFGWQPEDCRTATEVWERLVSLPIFPDMTEKEITYVVSIVKELCRKHGKRPVKLTKTTSLAFRPQ